MNNRHTIYLDYAATTPLDPRVLEAMRPYFSEYFGNSSSVHLFGQKAEAALEIARFRMAQLIACEPGEIIYTSGGSESDNLALRGVAMAMKQKKGADHILISPVEHHAVTRTAEQLRDYFGFELDILPCNKFGQVDPQDVAAYLKPTTAIVSVIYANNEIGSINPIKEIAQVCRERGVLLHSDAVQAGAHLPINVATSDVDLLSLGAHKFYGPKGVGALYIRKGTPILPTQTGGSQEFGLRAGTHNIPYIVGMDEAFCLAQGEAEQRRGHLLPLRDRLVGHVLEEIPGSYLTGHTTERLPNHASFVFEGVDGNQLTMMLDVEGFACSSGSACKTGSPEPSDVLLATGYPPELALGSLRVTMGSTTMPADIDSFLHTLPKLINRQRMGS
jgi:cysteine desulfurase